MNIKTFIDRPILAGVISVIILLLGIIGLTQLPIEQFPEIAPPTVSVSAAYAGANAETVQKSVLVPLEEAINGVEDILSHQQRLSEHTDLFPSGNRRRHGDGQCAEQDRIRTESPAG